MEIEMKKQLLRSDIEKLVILLKNIENTFTGDLTNDFLYKMYKSLEKLEAELEVIYSIPALQYPDAYDKYESDRLALVGVHAEKNADGSLKTIPGTNDALFLSENQAKFNTEFDAFNATPANVSLLAKVEAVNLERVTFMEGTSEVEITEVPFNELPELKTEGKPTGWVMDALSALGNLTIKED
jgi:hypothetical protein